MPAQRVPPTRLMEIHGLCKLEKSGAAKNQTVSLCTLHVCSIRECRKRKCEPYDNGGRTLLRLQSAARGEVSRRLEAGV